MKKILPFINILIGVVLILFIGIKHHPEFNEQMVIVKHKPSLDFVFYSPIGDSDLTLEELPEHKRADELLYQEYVKRPNARTIDNMALLFFQVGIFLILSSLLQLIFFRRKYSPRLNRVLGVNFMGLLVLLGLYQIFWTASIELWKVVAIQVVVNLLLIFPLLRKNR